MAKDDQNLDWEQKEDNDTSLNQPTDADEAYFSEVTKVEEKPTSKSEMLNQDELEEEDLDEVA